MITELYVLLFLGPLGRAQYTADPPLVLPRALCLSEARIRNSDIRRGGPTLMEYVCEVRS